MRRNAFLTFLCSLLPGAGQMYQGYMKRGLSLALLFMIPIILGDSLMPVLMSLAAVVYMYSFFDSLNLHAQLKAHSDEGGPAVVHDDYLVHLGGLGAGDFQKLISGKHHLLGWGCVILGATALYQTLLRPMLDSLIWLIPSDGIRNGLLNIVYHIPQVVFAVVLVWLGLWLIRGPKNKEEEVTLYQGEKNG